MGARKKKKETREAKGRVGGRKVRSRKEAFETVRAEDGREKRNARGEKGDVAVED